MEEKLIKLCPVKSAQGTYWENKYCRNQPLRKILISQSSSSIAFLQFVAEDLKTIDLIPSERHGSEVDDNFYVIELDCNEHITSVSGYHCTDSANGRKVLCSLTIVTNLRSHGPFGRPYRHGDKAFKYVTGRSFAGFHGTTVCGEIESLGIFIKIA